MSSIKDFWNMVLSNDEKINLKGYELWTKFLSEHPHYRQEVCKFFSKKFSNIYTKTNFHDFCVSEAGLFVRNKKTFFKIVLHDNITDFPASSCYELVYGNITNLTMNFASTNFETTWYNDIFEIHDNGLITHRIQCTNGTYIVITFKNIKISKQKTKQ